MSNEWLIQWWRLKASKEMFMLFDTHYTPHYGLLYTQHNTHHATVCCTHNIILTTSWSAIHTTQHTTVCCTHNTALTTVCYTHKTILTTIRSVVSTTQHKPHYGLFYTQHNTPHTTLRSVVHTTQHSPHYCLLYIQRTTHHTTVCYILQYNYFTRLKLNTFTWR